MNEGQSILFSVFRSPFPYGSDIDAYKLDINQVERLKQRMSHRALNPFVCAAKDCGGIACGNKEIIEVIGLACEPGH